MTQHKQDGRDAAQIAHLKQLLACLREVGHVLNREKALEPLCQQVCASLARMLNYATVWIGRPGRGKALFHGRRLLGMIHPMAGGRPGPPCGNGNK